MKMAAMNYFLESLIEMVVVMMMMMMKVIMHIEDLIRDDGTEEVGDASKGLVAHHHAALLHHTALCHHVSSSVIMCHHHCGCVDIVIIHTHCV